MTKQSQREKETQTFKVQKPSEKGTAPAQGKGTSAARLGRRPDTGR